MDDGTVLKVYGNAGLGEGSEDGPLVTFALLAYNQEKYIREAIVGAFSQTYSPLEIVLSDDCSSDRTFEIMQEMAREYKGPHLVKVRRGVNNCGVIDHLIYVAKLAKGELIVVAAGDDISLDVRVEKLAKAWIETSASALYSGSVDITDHGEVIIEENIPVPLDRIQLLFAGCASPMRHNGFVRNIPGYSAAYEKKFLKELPLNHRKIHNEDALTTYLANLRGDYIHFVREALVQRRDSRTSISAKSSQSKVYDIMHNEMVVAKFSKSTLDFIDYFSTLHYLVKSNDFQTVMRRLLGDRNYYYVVANFWINSFFQRFILLLRARDVRAFKYIVPRLLGKRAFFVMKSVSYYLRRKR